MLNNACTPLYIALLPGAWGTAGAIANTSRPDTLRVTTGDPQGFRYRLLLFRVRPRR